MSSFPVLRTRLSVCFLSSFLDSLPQPFLKCFPFAFAFGLFPFLPLSFVRFCSGSDYSASVSSFPLSSRFPLTVVSSVLLFCFRFLGFPRSFRPSFPCLLSRFFVLSFLHFLSPFALSPHSGYLSASPFFLSASGLFSFAFALGSGYLA